MLDNFSPYGKKVPTQIYDCEGKNREQKSGIDSFFHFYLYVNF